MENQNAVNLEFLINSKTITGEARNKKIEDLKNNLIENPCIRIIGDTTYLVENSSYSSIGLDTRPRLYEIGKVAKF